MKPDEKIDFLMKITDVSNSTLGKCLSFDASYISRIRSGTRSLPKNQLFLSSASAYFAEHIHSSYQKHLAAEMICPGREWPDSEPTARELIAGWLVQPDHGDVSPVGKILSEISEPKLPSLGTAGPVAVPDSKKEVQFFYGNSGKREAVTLFLSDLVKLDNPPRLMLYSNEEFSWLYEDVSFAREWVALLKQYVQKGGRIKIAHTVSRASGEMLVALQKWIPIYMTGAVEPCYYPKILDRVFRKTLFVAEGHSAIVAGSVGERTEQAVNCLVRDREAVGAIEGELRNFLVYCKPLMQIFNMTRRDAFFELLRNFNNVLENMITFRTTPSFFTMPDSVAKSMTERLDGSWLMKRQQSSTEIFDSMMRGGKTLTELCSLPPAEEVLRNGVEFPMCDLFDKPGLAYTPAEFAAHLENVIDRLENNAGYEVSLTPSVPTNELIYAKEDMGVILVKSDAPSIAFATDEPRVVSAFWEYLNEMKAPGKKEKTIEQLNAYLRQLREGL